MIHVLRQFAGVAAIVALVSPAIAAPVVVPGGHHPVSRPVLDLPLVMVNCNDPEPEFEPPSESESFRSANAPRERIFLACDGAGQNYDFPGATGIADTVESTIERSISHCRAYTDVWRVDCLSNELERLAYQLPNDRASRKAKLQIRAAAAKLRALAEANADPAQPAVRRAADIDGTRRTTTRPITAVAPSRVVATNLAADQVITELSTTLLRSASAGRVTEFTRIAAAVDSTKVLLRST